VNHGAREAALPFAHQQTDVRIFFSVLQGHIASTILAIVVNHDQFVIQIQGSDCCGDAIKQSRNITRLIQCWDYYCELCHNVCLPKDAANKM
jgi:hypothetical protein